MSQLVVRAMQNVVVCALRMAKASPLTVELQDQPGEQVQVVVTYVWRWTHGAGPAIPPPCSTWIGPYTQQQHGLRVDRCRGLYFVRATARLHGGQTQLRTRYTPMQWRPIRPHAALSSRLANPCLIT